MWEYKLLAFPFGKPDPFLENANDAGREGWEAVGLAFDPKHADGNYLVLFKRPLAE